MIKFQIISYCLISALTLAFSGGPVWASATENTEEIPATFHDALKNYQDESYGHAYAEFETLSTSKKISTRERILAQTGLGASAYLSSKLHRSLIHYKQALKLLEAGKPDLHLKAELICSLGDVYYELEKYPLSIHYFKESLALSEAKDGSYDIFMRSLEGLAASYFNSKKVKFALPIYEEMAWRDRHSYGSLSVQYGWSLRILADVYAALHDQEKAKICFERSIWNFRLSDRDRLLKELAGKSKYDNEVLAAKLTERTIGIRTTRPEPENLHPAFTHQKEHPEPIIINVSDGDGQNLPWQRKRTVMQQPAGMQWINPDVETRGIVICVPGFGLHRTSFSALGKRLAQEGYSVYAYDVRGFGSNTTLKARDRIDLFKTMDDLEASAIAIKHDNPDLPVFILGESMGGSIALQFTALHPELVDGLVAAVPSSKRYRQFKLVSKVGLEMLFGSKEPINAAPTVLNRVTDDADLKHEVQKIE